MQPDPKAAEDFAKLVLVTARTLRRLIQEPIKPRTRAEMLTELNDALHPFDEPDELGLVHAPHCAVNVLTCDAECNCGAWSKAAMARGIPASADPDHTHDNGELPKPLER